VAAASNYRHQHQLNRIALDRLPLVTNALLESTNTTIMTRHLGTIVLQMTVTTKRLPPTTRQKWINTKDPTITLIKAHTSPA
jgi:hypothetical protein